MDTPVTAAPQNILLENRSRLRITGVEDVDAFDDASVTVNTVLGTLTVSGTDLHIGALNTETGELFVEGNIHALLYTESEQKGGGFFSRVFK